MDKERFKLLEVKANEKGYYLVTLFQFQKEEPEDPDYFKEWLEFDGDNWEYGYYEDYCYVCFVHERYDAES